MPIPLGELNGQLLHAGIEHRDKPLTVTVCHLCLSVERT
jgi:hypothetical protein